MLVASGMAAAAQQTFNPHSVHLDIRTPEELAAVNQFLVALGRDVAQAGTPQFAAQQQQQQSQLPSRPGLGYREVCQSVLAADCRRWLCRESLRAVLTLY